MKLTSMIVALSGLLFLGCGSDGMDCSGACDKIFGECGLSSLDSPGGRLTASNCVSMCEMGEEQAPDVVSSMLSCIDKNSCDNLSICQ